MKTDSEYARKRSEAALKFQTDEQLLEKLRIIGAEDKSLSKKLIIANEDFLGITYHTLQQRHPIYWWAEKLNYSTRAKQRLVTEDEVRQKLREIFEEYGNINSELLAITPGICFETISRFKSLKEWQEEFGIGPCSSQTVWLDLLEKFLPYPLIREKSFETCRNPETGKRLRFDGYIEELGVLIEYQDQTHYYEVPNWPPLSYRQMKDAYKVEWAKENNFRLLVVSYYDEPLSIDFVKRFIKENNLGG